MSHVDQLRQAHPLIESGNTFELSDPPLVMAPFLEADGRYRIRALFCCFLRDRDTKADDRGTRREFLLVPMLREIKMRFKDASQGILLLLCVGLATSQPAFAQSGGASKEQLRRGQYLATFAGCGDCHTPKVMTLNGPAPDTSRLLSGHRADAAPVPIPMGVLTPSRWAAMTNSDLTAWAGPWGISFAANLTPDKETGLGDWTVEQFIKSMRTGKHLGVGRSILPPMPWSDIAVLTDKDMKALFAYLKSLKPIANPVPQPIAPK